MQLHNRSSLTCRHRQHAAVATSVSRARLVIASARSRRTASPSPQDGSVTPEQPSDTTPESTAAAAPPAAAVPLVRSSRRATSPAASRNRRGTAQKPVVSPAQTLKDKGVIATNADGAAYVNIACLGQGQPHWYALQLLENKEDTFIASLAAKLDPLGYSIAPTFFTPTIPPTAAEAATKSAATAAAALDDATAQHEDATAWFEEAKGGPGEAGAAIRLKEAEEKVKLAEKAVEDLVTGGAAAAAAAVESEKMLGQYDVVFWKPRKVKTVYSHNTDKLVDREVSFSRGTGGAVLLMHCRLDSVLAEAVSTTYYFLDWRDFQPVSAVLLKQHDLLPEEVELDDVFKLPEPCSESFLLQLSNWQHTREAEDLDKERTEYYGTAGGDVFGARPERGARRDESNPSRWSVSAGPTNAGAAALIAAGEPLPWEQEQQQQQQEQQEQQGFGRGRGRGRGRRGGEGGRGEWGGRQQQRWEQDGQQYGQPQQQYQQRGGFDQGYGGGDGWEGGRGRGGRGGRGGRFGQQQQQQQFGQRSGFDQFDQGYGGGRGRGGRGWQQQEQQRSGFDQFDQGYGVGRGRGGRGGRGRQQQQFEQRDGFDQFDQGYGGGRGRGGRGGRGWQQQEQQQWRQQDGFDQFDRGYGGGDSWEGGRGRGGRGGRGRQQQEQQQFRQRGGFDQTDGFDQFDQGYGGGDSWEGGRGRGGRGGRGWQQQEQQQWRQQDRQQPPPKQRYAVAAAAGSGDDWNADGDASGGEGGFSEQNRMKQMDWMGELGGDRYRDDDMGDAGFDSAAKAAPRSSSRQGRDDWEGDVSGGDEGFGEQNRMKQMGWMEELGGSRYRDGEDGGSDAAANPAPRNAGRQGRGSSDDSSGGGWQQQQQPRQQWQQERSPSAGQDGGTTRMRQLDFMGALGSDRYSDEDDAVNYDRLEGLDGSRQGLGPQQQQQGRPVGGGKDRGANMQQQLGFMAEMGSDRYSDSEEGFEAAKPLPPRGGKGLGSSGGGNAGGRANSSSSVDLSMLSDFADDFDFIDDGSTLPPQNPNAGRSNNAAGGQGLGFSRGSQNPGRASYMDEDTMEWGREGAGGDVSMGGDEGATAARQVLQDWQSEGQQQQQRYNAEVSTRSQEGLGASFEFESAGPGLASADSLLGQLPPLEADLGVKPQQQQQQQQQQEPPPAAAAAAKLKSRAGTSSRRSRKTEEGAGAAAPAAASSRRKTSTRKAAGDTAKQRKGSAAAAAEGPLDGWVGGADASDEGYEEGWVDRMMDDGNDRAGIDDVMRS